MQDGKFFIFPWAVKACNAKTPDSKLQLNFKEMNKGTNKQGDFELKVLQQRMATMDDSI